MREKIESLHVMYVSWYGIVTTKPVTSGMRSLGHRWEAEPLWPGTYLVRQAWVCGFWIQVVYSLGATIKADTIVSLVMLQGSKQKFVLGMKELVRLYLLAWVPSTQLSVEPSHSLHKLSHLVPFLCTAALKNSSHAFLYCICRRWIGCYTLRQHCNVWGGIWRNYFHLKKWLPRSYVYRRGQHVSKKSRNGGAYYIYVYIKRRLWLKL